MECPTEGIIVLFTLEDGIYACISLIPFLKLASSFWEVDMIEPVTGVDVAVKGVLGPGNGYNPLLRG